MKNLKSVAISIILGVFSQICFANEIVYLNQGKVLGLSVCLKQALPKINDKYYKKIGQLEKQQAKLKLDIEAQNQKSNSNLQIEYMQLQQNLEDANAEKAKEIQNMQASFVQKEQVVLDKLKKDNKYSYILSSTAVYDAESANDISQNVVKLTDKECLKSGL